MLCYDATPEKVLYIHTYNNFAIAIGNSVRDLSCRQLFPFTISIYLLCVFAIFLSFLYSLLCRCCCCWSCFAEWEWDRGREEEGGGECVVDRFIGSLSQSNKQRKNLLKCKNAFMLPLYGEFIAFKSLSTIAIQTEKKIGRGKTKPKYCRHNYFLIISDEWSLCRGFLRTTRASLDLQHLARMSFSVADLNY